MAIFNNVPIEGFGQPEKELILGRKCFEVLKGRNFELFAYPIMDDRGNLTGRHVIQGAKLWL